MTWIEPKTTWNGSSTEYFNITPDYSRIKGNIEHLDDFSDNVISSKPNTLYTLETLTTSSDLYVYHFNNIVANINYLRDNLKASNILVENYQYMRTYTENNYGWDFSDLNIIENNLLRIYNVIDKYYNAKSHLPIMLGIREEF